MAVGACRGWLQRGSGNAGRPCAGTAAGGSIAAAKTRPASGGATAADGYTKARPASGGATAADGYTKARPASGGATAADGYTK
ncbi:hypothetical protein AB0H83_03605, partial [Dactylosporangium sp. NPDC050688]